MGKEIHSKELVGVQRGVYEVRALLKADHGVVWKPKIQFIVVSKDPIERFGVASPDKITPLRKPCVVHAGITNKKLWDFFIWGYHPNSHIDKIKPKRFVVLRDELKLGVLKVPAAAEKEKSEPEPSPKQTKGKGRKGKKGKAKKQMQQKPK